MAVTDVCSKEEYVNPEGSSQPEPSGKIVLKHVHLLLICPTFKNLGEKFFVRKFCL